MSAEELPPPPPTPFIEIPAMLPPGFRRLFEYDVYKPDEKPPDTVPTVVLRILLVA
jgi:hypothetical protein